MRALHKSDVGCICTCARAHLLRTMVPPRPLVHRRSRRHTGFIFYSYVAMCSVRVRSFYDVTNTTVAFKPSISMCRHTSPITPPHPMKDGVTLVRLRHGHTSHYHHHTIIKTKPYHANSSANHVRLFWTSANTEKMVGAMGGECRMAGVAVATPTLPVPHQHFALLSLLATPTLTCWLIILCLATPTLEAILRPWSERVVPGGYT